MVGFASAYPFVFFAIAIPESSIVSGLLGMLVLGPIAGAIFGIAGGFAGALATRPPAIDRPSRLVQQGLAHFTAVIVAVGGVVGFMVGCAYGLIYNMQLKGSNMDALMTDLEYALMTGLEYAHTNGIVYGLPVGLVFVANSPWPRYLIATMILAHRGELPRRPAVFLDWAYEAGLMRLSGISVQFRHRDFQTWLVTHGQSVDGHPAGVGTTGLTATDEEQEIAQNSSK